MNSQYISNKISSFATKAMILSLGLAIPGLITTPAQAIINSGTTFTTGLGLGNSTEGFFANKNTELIINGGTITEELATGGFFDVDAVLTPGANSDILTVTYTAQDSTTDLFPSGFNAGGDLLDLGGYFVGSNAGGGTPISLDGSQGDFQVNFEFFDDGLNVLNTGTGNITGPFDGSYGFNLGSDIVNQSIDRLIVTTTVQESTASVPFEFSPTLGLFAVGGIWGVSRLRKRMAASKIIK